MAEPTTVEPWDLPTTYAAPIDCGTCTRCEYSYATLLLNGELICGACLGFAGLALAVEEVNRLRAEIAALRAEVAARAEPEWQPVDSSNIAAARYDNFTCTLDVRFQTAQVYRYLDVPRDIFVKFCTAESKGAFLAAHIKGKHEYTKLEAQADAVGAQ